MAGNNPNVIWAVAGLTAAGAGMYAGASPNVSAMVGVAIGVVGVAVQSLVKPPVVVQEDFFPEEKSKKKKKAAAKKAKSKSKAKKKKPAPKKVESEEEEEEEEVVVEKEEPKKLTKKQKQKAKKARQAAEAAAKKAAEDAAAAKKKKKNKKKKQAAEAPAPVEEPTKKKKKNKKKKVVVSSSDDEEEPQLEDGWEVQRSSKSSKQKRAAKAAKAAAASGDSASGSAPVEVMLTIPSKFYGKIIGENGVTRQALTDATGAEIDIPKKGGMRDYIMITGPKESCAAAKQAIEELVAKGYCSLLNADTMDDGIEVPAKLHGLIIGPGGSNIKKIQAKTGCKVNTPDRDSDSNRITVVGDAAGVRMALAAIKELVEHGYSSLTHENYVTDSVMVQASMVSMLIGAGGQTIKDLQKRTGTKINIPDSRNSGVISIDVIGEPEGVNAARVLITRLMLPPKPVPVPEEWSQSATALMVNVW